MDEDSRKTDSQEPKAMLEEILRRMGLEVSITATPGELEKQVLLQVESEDAAQIIGRNAHGLEALQWLLNRMLSRRDPGGAFCVIDVDGYRERRRQRLEHDAREAADKVAQSGRPIRFLPLNAAERRIVHQALRDDQRVETESEPEDEDGLKRLIVRPAAGTTAEPEISEDDDNRGNV